MDRVVMQLSELVDVMQPVIDKQAQPTVLRPYQLCASVYSMYTYKVI